MRAGDFPYKERWANATIRTRSLAARPPGHQGEVLPRPPGGDERARPLRSPASPRTDPAPHPRYVVVATRPLQACTSPRSGGRCREQAGVNVPRPRSVCGIPALRSSPPIRPGLDDAHATGTGPSPRDRRGIELITDQLQNGRDIRRRRWSSAPRASAKSTCEPRLPPNSIAALRVVVSMPRRLSSPRRHWGRDDPRGPSPKLRTTSVRAPSASPRRSARSPSLPWPLPPRPTP